MHAPEPTTMPTDVQDDPQARELLRAAQEHNYHLPTDFGGFAAAITFRDGARELHGTLHAPSPRAMGIELPGATEDDLRWLRMELGSAIGHRLHLDFEQGEGRYVITADADDAHPYGRRIRLHGDPYQSSYRVLNNELREVDRTMGQQHFTITIHASTTTPDAHYVSTHYSAAYFDTATQRLIRSDAYVDDFEDVDGAWLPNLRRVVTADDSGLRVREVRLHDLRLLHHAAEANALAEHVSTRATQDSGHPH